MDEQIVNREGNRTCVICEGKNPSWGCHPFGVLCCTRCSGAFRELGASHCVVRSLLLDSVSEEYLSVFRKSSNGMFLRWFRSRRPNADLNQSYFKTKESQEYVDLLRQDKIKEHRVQSAPRLPPIPPRQEKRSRLKILRTEDEVATPEEKAEESGKKEKPKVKEEVPVTLPSTPARPALRRVPGKVTADSLHMPRLGMFKNIEKQKSPVLGAQKLLKHIGSSEASTEEAATGTVSGRGYVGSADPPKETVSEKIKKGIKSGKSSLFSYIQKMKK